MSKTTSAEPAFDPEEHRRASLEHWEGAAEGWEKRQREMREFSAPVAERLLEALELRGGERVLDIAAGVGETGLLAAKRVGEAGHVIIGDQAEGMVQAAKRRADQLGLGNVEVRLLDAESIDLDVGALDAVLCRWGIMLLADPHAALSECRRVLRPGGKLAIAVWGRSRENEWARAPMAVLVERGLMPPPVRGAYVPGMFALSDPADLSRRLQDAGFTGVAVGSVQLSRRHESFEELWAATLDIAAGFREVVAAAPEHEREAIREATKRRLQPFVHEDGSIEIPGVTLVATAEA